jgi:phosphoadenosine phosphosulfate reductase
VGNVFVEAANDLSNLSSAASQCLVFYSGGKDSLCTLDLCSRAFKKVVGVFMYFVPGLEVAQERLDFAHKQWPGVEFIHLPHWMLSGFFYHGVYCFRPHGADTIPDLKIKDIYALARKETGIDLICTGGKHADGMWRKRQMRNLKDNFLIYPIKNWSKWDVAAYLSSRKIPFSNKFDLDLGERTLLWLYDEHRADFERVMEIFPHVEAIVKRREFFGDGKEKKGR